MGILFFPGTAKDRTFSVSMYTVYSNLKCKNKGLSLMVVMVMIHLQDAIDKRLTALFIIQHNNRNDCNSMYTHLDFKY